MQRLAVFDPRLECFVKELLFFTWRKDRFPASVAGQEDFYPLIHGARQSFLTAQRLSRLCIQALDLRTNYRSL